MTGEPEEIGRSREELEQLLNALRQGKLEGREIYRAIQAFGENNFQVARPEVEALLKNDDFELRFVALKVLTRYWHLAEHWETSRQVMLHDPEVENRFRAAEDLGALQRNTCDVQTLSTLAAVVCNKQERRVVREAAYAAMLEVLHYNPREQFRMSTRSFDFDKEVDWDMVRRYCS